MLERLKSQGVYSQRVADIGTFVYEFDTQYVQSPAIFTTTFLHFCIPLKRYRLLLTLIGGLL
jgi:hypothetical protein